MPPPQRAGPVGKSACSAIEALHVCPGTLNQPPRGIQQPCLVELRAGFSVFLERDETGLKRIRSGSSEISPRTGRFRLQARSGFSLGCVFQHDLSEAAVLERERCGCAGSRLLAIPLQRGAHCAKNEALRLRFGAADEREITAAAWARRGLGQAGSASRAAFQTHASR